MSDYFDLLEHRKTVQSRTIRLSADLSGIPMYPSNEDEVQNQMRFLEADRLAEQSGELQARGREHFANGRDDQAREAIRESVKVANNGLTLLLETLRTMVCTDDGKKLTLAQLRAAVGNQEEALLAITNAIEARTVDPQKPNPNGSSSS